MTLDTLQDYFVENRGRLIPLVMLLLIAMSLCIVFVKQVFPAWQVYQGLSSQLETGQQQLAEREALANEDNTSILQAQIESVHTELNTIASDMLTTEQAETILSRLYGYADASAVEITALQLQQQVSAEAQTARQRQPVTPITSYASRSFHIEVAGETEALLDFVTRIQEATLATVVISNLNVNTSPSGAVLSLTLTIYESPYADGLEYANLVLLNPVSADMPVILPSAATAIPVETVELATAPDTSARVAVQDMTLDDAMLLLVNVRSDLELLASAQLGANRPEGWSGSSDRNNPQFALLIRLDLEILAGNVLGEHNRPEGWIGGVPGTLLSIAQDSRHDLELLADTLLNGVRPDGWNGANPLLRCNRSTVALVQHLLNNTDFTYSSDFSGADFCTLVEAAASEYANTHLINIDVSGVDNAEPASEYVINSRFAVAFNNRAASLRLGVIPENTAIVPIGRSYTLFSNMMLVRGDNFEVFVDYHYTSVSEAEFFALTDINILQPEIACREHWCSGN